MRQICGRLVGAVMVAWLLVACGESEAPPDGSVTDGGTDTVTDSATEDTSRPDLVDTSVMDAGDTATDTADAPDASDVADAPDAPATDAPDGADLPDAVTAPGTATWTLVPNPTCTATVAPTCLDAGAFGGYQIAAGAACPLNNGVGVYLPGGALPPAGTYTVKPVATDGDALNLTAGQIAVSSTYHPDISTQETWWAQSGTVTVSVAGGKVSYSAADLQMLLRGTATTTTLSASVSCP